MLNDDSPIFQILDENKIEEINKATLKLLSETGVKIDDEKIKSMLKDNGATINDDMVCIPDALIHDALKSSPDEIKLYDKYGEEVFQAGKNDMCFGTHADMLEFLDPYTKETRDFRRKDTKMMAKIANSLDNIDFMLSVGLASDVPEEIQSQMALLDSVKNFNKIINFSSNNAEGLKEQIKILEIVSESWEDFKENPFAFYYCEPIPPLYHPKESTDKLQIVAEAEVPSVYMPYCMLGGTAPVTFAGALAQSNAEILSGLVIHQIINPGAPFIYGAMPSIFDMKTTIGSYGAPEFNMLIAASSEIADYYNLPFYGTAGTTDASKIDEQAVSEVTISCFATVLSCADLVHDVGLMEHCNCLSPELVVLFSEILDMTKIFKQGVPVNEEELSLDIIKEVGAAGHFLTHPHTNDNFKNIWYPEIFQRKMEGGDKSEIRYKLKTKIENIMESEDNKKLNSKTKSKLESIEEELIAKTKK